MKKLIFIILVCLIWIQLSAQSYSMLTTLWQNRSQYNTYLQNGSTIKAEASAQKLLQGTNIYSSCIGASFQGRSGLRDSLMLSFDILYGKTHTPPTFELTSVSYLDLDSLSVDGVMITSIYPKDSILSWIGASGLDTAAVLSLIDANSIDSTFLNARLGIFRDSLDVTQDVKDSVLLWISDGINEDMIFDTLRVGSETPGVAKMWMDNGEFKLNTGGDATNVTYEAISGAVYLKGTDNSKVIIGNDAVQLNDNSGNSVLYNGVVLRIINPGTGLYDTLISYRVARTLIGSGGGTSVGDSSWVSASTNRLILNTYPNSVYLHGGSREFIVIDSISGSYLIYNTYQGNMNADASTGNLSLNFKSDPSSTSPNIIPNSNVDGNTGYTWVGADKLGLVAGAQSTFTSEYVSSKKINNAMDSLIATGIKANRGHFDSVKVNGEWNKNIVSYSDVPSGRAIRVVNADGSQEWVDVDTLGNAVTETLNPAQFTGLDTVYTKVYDSTHAYYTFMAVVKDTIALSANVVSATTITPSGDFFHVTGTTTINTITYTGEFQEITILFDGVAPLGTAGNIKTALTPTVNTGYELKHDGTKWFIIQ